MTFAPKLRATSTVLSSQSLITTTISSTQPATLPRLRGRLSPSFLAVIDTLMGKRSGIADDDVRAE
jgi:hypothetical protein